MIYFFVSYSRSSPLRPKKVVDMSFNKTSTNSKIDPLYVIFEKQLYDFNDSNIDRATFINNVIEEYLFFLKQNNLSVPKKIEKMIFEELSVQVGTMLTKKIYGFMNVSEYCNQVDSKQKKTAKSKFKKLKTKRLKA